jgi:hypothetical protein
MTLGQKIEAFFQLREHKQKAEAEFKQSLERVNDALDLLESELLSTMNEQGVDRLSCAAGTVFQSKRTSETIQDRDTYMKFVVENDLLSVACDIKANKTFVGDFISEHGAPPPGVKYSEILKLNARRGS